MQNPIEAVSGSKEEGMLTFRLSVSHLPVYACSVVKPSAWIVQNDHLLSDSGQTVREEFVFRTEQTSLQPLRIYADYPIVIRLCGQDPESAVADLWRRLGMSADRTAVVSVTYQYRIPGRCGELFFKVPVTFLPEASDADLVENIRDWLSETGYELSEGSRLGFDVTVYPGTSSAALVHAVFEQCF